MLDYCVAQFLRPNGDFSLAPSSGAANCAPLADALSQQPVLCFFAEGAQLRRTAGSAPPRTVGCLAKN